MGLEPDRLDHNQELYQLSYAHHVAGRGPRPAEHSAPGRGADHPEPRPVTCVAWAW